MKLPQPQTSAYRACVALHKHGPMTREQLLATVDMGDSGSSRNAAMARAVTGGWIVRSGTKFDVSGAVRKLLDEQGDVVEIKQPQVAPSRSFDFMRPAYKSPINSRGSRADIPDWSQRTEKK